ncbi:MAG: serine/threonine protein kinase [Deltaproteobacteria bacterium]|nr:serine/threonine protein kinase [Deltaproteobacteria bacterium]
MVSPDPEPSDIAPPLKGGRLRLVRILGEGGVGTVYLARDDRVGGYRAVKILSAERRSFPAQRQRFEDEARIQTELQHPNIVRVFERFEEGDRVCFLMEYVPNGSLWERLQAHGPLPPHAAASAMTGVLAALEAAHALGIVHRDIKPHNILLGPGDVPKLADFGVAHHSMDGAADLTRTGVVMGTWSFMAPEQRASSRRVDPRSDVYAAGSTLYTLLTHRMEQNLFDMDARDSAFEGIPARLASIIVRATRYAREDRYPSAGAMRADLEAVLREMPAGPDGSAVRGQAVGEGIGGVPRDQVFRGPVDLDALPSPVPPGPEQAAVPSVRIDAGKPPPSVAWTLDDERSSPRARRSGAWAGRGLALGLAALVVTGIAYLALRGGEPEIPATIQRTVAIPATPTPAPAPASRPAVPTPATRKPASPRPQPEPPAPVAARPPDPVPAGPEPSPLPSGNPEGPAPTLGADPSEVARWVADRHRDEILGCHARFLTDDPDTRGNVALVWTVVEGAVSSAGVLANTTGVVDLGRCLAETSRSWAFPAGFAADGLTHAIRLDPAETSGWEIERAGASRTADLASCGGRSAPRVRPPLVLVLAVEAGRVREASVRDPGGHPAETAACLARKATSWRFPTWVAGTWIVPVGP